MQAKCYSLAGLKGKRERKEHRRLHTAVVSALSSFPIVSEVADLTS